MNRQKTDNSAAQIKINLPAITKQQVKTVGDLSIKSNGRSVLQSGSQYRKTTFTIEENLGSFPHRTLLNNLTIIWTDV